MTKNSKILASGLVAVLLVGTFVFYGGGDLFQGRFSRDGVDTDRGADASECNMAHGNHAPPSGVVIKKWDSVRFKWNGPGCSEYDFSQYSLCFENAFPASDALMDQEFWCIGVIPHSNDWTLSAEDWALIDGAMKTTKNDQGHVGMRWYVMSKFGDSFEGETLKTEGWEVTYLK